MTRLPIDARRPTSILKASWPFDVHAAFECTGHASFVTLKRFLPNIDEDVFLSVALNCGTRQRRLKIAYQKLKSDSLCSQENLKFLRPATHLELWSS